jgi:uncharacterized protein YjbJ (UPF0337 family)
MNKDTLKGTIDEAAGRAKRQVGEWTGDTKTQVDGAAQQIKGEVEKVVGSVKDAAKDVSKDENRERDNEEREHRRLEEERKHHEAIGS